MKKQQHESGYRRTYVACFFTARARDSRTIRQKTSIRTTLPLGPLLSINSSVEYQSLWEKPHSANRSQVSTTSMKTNAVQFSELSGSLADTAERDRNITKLVQLHPLGQWAAPQASRTARFFPPRYLLLTSVYRGERERSPPLP